MFVENGHYKNIMISKIFSTKINTPFDFIVHRLSEVPSYIPQSICVLSFISFQPEIYWQLKPPSSSLSRQESTLYCSF